MRKRMNTKLASQHGASFSMALLLLLVCTVISSVILISGTAASGRLASLARMDQHYYSVTSAIELIKDELENSTTTVEETLVCVETVTPATSDDGEDTSDYEIKSDIINSIKSKDGATDSDLGINFTRYLMAGTTQGMPIGLAVSSTSMSESGWEDFYATWEDGIIPSKTSCDAENALTFGITAKQGSESIDALQASAKVIFFDEESGTVMVENSVNALNTITYAVHALLVSEIQAEHPIVSAVKTGPYETTYTITKTVTIKWSLEDATVGQVNT